MKAVSYARVSSKEQEDTGYSLPAQTKLLQEYAERRDLKITKTFSVAESASGSKQRKVFGEMMGHLREKNIHYLLCEKVDRLTRNLKEAMIVNDWLEEDENRQIHFVKQNLTISKNSKSDEKFRWDIEIVLAKKYIANLSEEVKKGQKEKLSQGWLPTKPPLGYRTVGEKGHKIHIIDETRGVFIQTMFELYASGNYSITAVVNEMYKKGLRNNSGQIVGRSRMHKLLSDPFYCGKVRWKNQIYKGSHKALISPLLFEQVQKILNRKTYNPQYKKHLPVFKAKVHCEECGGTVTWELQKGRWYGHCNRYRECSQKKSIREDRAEEILTAIIAQVAPKSDRVLAWLEKALKESHAEESENHAKKQGSIMLSIKRADNRLEQAYKDKLDGAIDAVLCQKVMSEAKEEKELLVEALQNLGEGHTAYYEAGYAIHELACQAQAIYQSPKATTDERRLLLSYAFSNLTLKEGNITPNYTLAFDFLSTWVPQLNNAFELQDNGSTKRQNGTFVPSHPILLRE